MDSPVQSTLEAPIYVAGFTVRTNNAAEMTENGKIGKLWARFFQENLGAHIPNRADQTLIVVYSDYASDETSDYTYLLGAPVTSVTGLPAGMSYRTIPAGRYAVFVTPKGPLVAGVQSTWKRIWSTPPVRLGGYRAFQDDYEIYDQRSADPNNAQVEIHIGLKPASYSAYFTEHP